MKRIIKKLLGRSYVPNNSSSVVKSITKARTSVDLPFSGFEENRVKSGTVEFLSDEDLHRLNDILPWMCFTADSQGRRFGSSAWKGKRDTPQQIPDPRIVEMNRLFDLARYSVLEVGCFEGIHTIALAQFTKQVHAVDSRIENVVKTLVRANMFGFSPQVTVCDLEQASDIARLPKVDLVHHVGVLYHLKDPVTHLFDLAKFTQTGILLDTHYATPEMATQNYTVGNKTYRYYSYGEKGRNEVFSGMYDHAKWLLLEDIKDILSVIGFADIRIFKDVAQRNGPRVTLYAAHTGTMKS